MSVRRGGLLLALALAVAPAAHADILLDGNQHIGDCTGSSCNGFSPADPVSRAQMQAKPSYFHLSHPATITAVRLESANDLDGRLQVFVDDMTTPLPGTLSGSTYALATPLALAAGTHTIWPDGGCSSGTIFASACGNNNENDFGFSAITLVSGAITFSRSFNRRSHLGDTSESSNDDYGGRWYPDDPDGTTRSFSFSVEASRVLSEIRFRRLRDVSGASQTPAAVTVDGNAMGTLTTNGDPVTLSPGATLAAGSHTLAVTAGLASVGDFDDISWDDIVLVMVNNPATTPGLFNAVDAGADAASGQLTTKQSGTAFDVDFVAVSGGGQLVTYNGTVSVELIDASDTARNCATWPALAGLGNATLVSGRATMSITYNEAVRDVRLRMTDASIAVTSCSTDNFAIRPATFGNIQASHADMAAAGTAFGLATGPFDGATAPVHKAGRPFTIRASAYNSVGAVTTGYAGSPTLGAASSLLGTFTGTASVGSWYTWPANGSIRTDQASYDEAGAVRLQLVDADFAAVDADDTPLATRQIGPVSFDAGRFVPDHFKFTELAAGSFAPRCAGGGFTYVGQPFFVATSPQARITAVAYDGVTATRNYSDPDLDRIVRHPASANALPTSSYPLYPALATMPAFDASPAEPDNTFVGESDGKFLLTITGPAAGYKFTRSALFDAFDADIAIVPTIADLDGVTLETSGRFGDVTSAGDGVAFTGNGKSMRFGRLAIDNALGSERLPLDVPVRAEYYAGGFQTNTADTCTAAVLDTTNFQLTTTLTTSASLAAVGPAGGLWKLTLSAPNAAGQVVIDGVLAAELPWLLTDREDADLDYDDEPQGLATFGLSNDRQRRIFQREVIGY